MKVWISRYAITRGIFEIECEELGNGDVYQDPKESQTSTFSLVMLKEFSFVSRMKVK